MSKIAEKRELLMCKIILEHYRFIKKMNDMSTEEFKEYIYGISPTVYSAFKNKGFKTVKNIISDYITITKNTLNIMKVSSIRSSDEEKALRYRQYKIISLLYTNKKTLCVVEVEKKIGISKSNFCRYHVEALRYFADIFNKAALRMGYQNALNNVDTRILEIMHLHKKALNKQ